MNPDQRNPEQNAAALAAGQVGPEQLHSIVSQATAAPSIHNTQPWRFRIGPDRLDLFADPTRALTVVDPTGRQLVLSCGAALEHAVLAARAAGLDVTVTPLPEPADPDHLATVAFPGAHAPTEEDQPLVAAMTRRHTHRGAFDRTPVPPALIATLTSGVAAREASLHALTEREDLVVASVLLDRADQLETADPAYRAELAAWRRHADSDSDAEADDGVPDSALPPVGPRTSLAMRDFAGDPADTRGRSEDEPVERPLVVVISTDRDDRAAWLAAGRSLGWVLLRAAADGVMASPLGQVIDLPSTRAVLGREMRLLGHPQMVLRMGYPTDDTASATRRRPADAVIDPSPGQSD